MKTYESVLMDVDGTLLDFDMAEEKGFKVVLRHYGFPVKPSYIERYHQINKRYWELFEGGEITRRQVLTERFEEYFSQFGMQVDGQEAEGIYRAQLENASFLIDGAIEICEYLKAKYRMYIVTNGISKTQYKRLGDSGLDKYFDDIFVSEDAGSQKPQRDFFEYCFSRMDNPDPGRMILIGDSLTSDMKGGNAAGIDTCWYNPARLTNDKGVSLQYEITALEDLKQIL